jgi:hypothetical protein
MTPRRCKEPSFNEMMREPIIRAVMECDAVEETELRGLLDRMRVAYDEVPTTRQAH